MGERYRATCSHADCVAKWRGAVGPIMACSGHGGKATGWHRPWFVHTLGLFEKNAHWWGGGRENVVTEEAVPGGGERVSAGWKGGGNWRMEKMPVVTRCSRLGKQRRRGEGQTNECVGMWVHWLKGERGEDTHGKTRISSSQRRKTEIEWVTPREEEEFPDKQTLRLW